MSEQEMLDYLLSTGLYEVRYRLPNGKVEAMITEWLWERQWNCIYPVIQWRNYNPIIKFPKQD